MLRQSPHARKLISALACALLAAASNVNAQKKPRPAATKAGAPAAASTASSPDVTSPTGNDEAYGAKIREYTTEKYFLTEFVDHLPASATVPSRRI